MIDSFQDCILRLLMLAISEATCVCRCRRALAGSLKHEDLAAHLQFRDASQNILCKEIGV